MNANVSEFPRHPGPPGPPQERPALAQQPTVFVYERQGWEYKIVSTNTADDPRATQDELNALGKDGWELIGLVPLSATVQFYLKRARA